MAKPSFFITTPIYYVNAKPHLGTAYATSRRVTVARRAMTSSSSRAWTSTARRLRRPQPPMA